MPYGKGLTPEDQSSGYDTRRMNPASQSSIPARFIGRQTGSTAIDRRVED